jgi:O-antigen ligase
MFPRSAFYETLSGATGMLGNRVISIANTQSDESILWRSAVWKSAAKKYMESPVFGIGFGQKVSVEIGKYHDFVEVRNIHNSFLVLFIQMGVLGILLIPVALVLLGLNVLKSKFEDENLQIAAYAAFGILVFQVTAFMFQPYLEANLLGIFFWINLGILRTLYKKEIE